MAADGAVVAACDGFHALSTCAKYRIRIIMNGDKRLFSSGVRSHLTTTEPKARALLIVASLVTLALCFVPNPYYEVILWPIRLFVTMIHESGHAVATVISGGSVNYIQIHASGEGVTWSAYPPWAYGLVLSGGYLGTTLFGALLLQITRFSGHQTSLRLVGGYVLAVTLLWANNPIDNLFTLVTGITIAVLLFTAAKYLTPAAAGFLVSFLAVQCCLNAIGDLRILLYLTTAMPGQDNDAVFMSQHYPLPPTFWAGLWAVCAVGILTASLWSYLRTTSKRGPLKRAALAH